MALSESDRLTSLAPEMHSWPWWCVWMYCITKSLLIFGCLVSMSSFFVWIYLGQCIPERDFWLHSLVSTFVSKFVTIYHLSFIILHHSSIHSSFFINSSIHQSFINSPIHQCINSSMHQFVFFIFSTSHSHRPCLKSKDRPPRSRGHETCAWRPQETFRDCGGWGPSGWVSTLVDGWDLWIIFSILHAILRVWEIFIFGGFGGVDGGCVGQFFFA